jgi:hypothetical protein
VPQGTGRSSKTVGVQTCIDAVKHLMTGSGVKAGAEANADGDPAADGMRVSLTVGRCNVERGTAFRRKAHF